MMAENNDQWALVHEALSDPEFDFRTVKGISNQTGLSDIEIERLLETHAAEVRQRLSRGDRTPIYTLRSRPAKLREILADLQIFASKSL